MGNIRKTKAITAQMALMEGVARVLAKHGFHKLGINLVAEEAGVDKNVIYRYFDGFDSLLHIYVEKQDYWLNAIKKHGETKIENHREFMKAMMVEQFDTQMKNTELRELLIWELGDKQGFASNIAIKRELLSEKLVEQYEKLLDGCGVGFNNFSALLISGIYYLALHKDKSTFCKIDLNKKEDQKNFKEFIEWIIDLVFDKIEHGNKIKQVAIKAYEKGNTIEDVAYITGLSVEQVSVLLS